MSETDESPFKPPLVRVFCPRCGSRLEARQVPRTDNRFDAYTGEEREPLVERRCPNARWWNGCAKW